jgi:hypothetical protein
MKPPIPNPPQSPFYKGGIVLSPFGKGKEGFYKAFSKS